MTLHSPYDPDNIFAKIIRGEIPCTQVYEDAETLSFMDLFPQSAGHTLVISKTAQANHLLDIEDAPLQTLILRTREIARAVEKALSPDGIRLAQFSGAAAGQTVFHLHFHIIPVYENTVLGTHGSGKQADPAELQAIAEKISSHL